MRADVFVFALFAVVSGVSALTDYDHLVERTINSNETYFLEYSSAPSTLTLYLDRCSNGRSILGVNDHTHSMRGGFLSIVCGSTYDDGPICTSLLERRSLVNINITNPAGQPGGTFHFRLSGSERAHLPPTLIKPWFRRINSEAFVCVTRPVKSKDGKFQVFTSHYAMLGACATLQEAEAVTSQVSDSADKPCFSVGSFDSDLYYTVLYFPDDATEPGVGNLMYRSSKALITEGGSWIVIAILILFIILVPIVGFIGYRSHSRSVHNAYSYSAVTESGMSAYP